MIRTSLFLPEPLHQRLQIVSRRRKQSVSSVVRDMVARMLMVEEQPRLDDMYAALDQVKGIGKEGITDASTTIDDVLYGEHGAWRGTMPE